MQASGVRLQLKDIILALEAKYSSHHPAFILQRNLGFKTYKEAKTLGEYKLAALSQYMLQFFHQNK